MDNKISIIIPVYNVENTIKRCLDSVLSQTCDCEIIVVNDGSTDGTKEILENDYKDKIMVIHQKNLGQGIARNVGIEHASGEYVGFVDGDDTIDKNMYSIMLKVAYEYSADVVQCNIVNVYPDGLRKVQLPEISCVVDRQNEPQYFSKYVYKNIHSFEVCNKIVKRELILKHKLAFHDTKEVHSEDLLFNLELIMKLNRIVFLPEHYYFYYLSKSNEKLYNEEKLLKLTHLFSLFTNKVESVKIIRQISGIAVLVLMQNIARLPDTKKNKMISKQFLKRKDIRKYLQDSMRQSKKIRHCLLMLTILTMPMDLKLFIIKFHYFDMK